MHPAALEADRLTAGLRRLAASGLLIEEGAGRFAFRHSLTRDAIYSTLLRPERQALHLGAGEALEQFALEGEGLTADLALHFHEAGAWQKALDYSRRAAERAQAMYAPREAVAHATRAIAAARALGREPPPDLYRARGRALDHQGAFEAALADFERAQAAAQAAGDAHAEWQSLIDLGFLWAARDYGRTGEYFRQALDLARAIGDQAALGHSLNRVGNWYGNIEQVEESLRCHREALEIFRARNDRAGLAETFDLLGLMSFLSGDIEQGTEYFEQAIQLFRERNDRPGLISALSNYSERGVAYLSAVMPLPHSTVAKATADGREAVRLAQEIGFAAGEAYAHLTTAICLVSAGDFAGSLAEVGRGHALAQEIGHQQWLAYAYTVYSYIYAEMLAASQAKSCAEKGLALGFDVGSLNFVRHASASLAEACLLAGFPSRAEFVLGTALGQPGLIAGLYPSAAELVERGTLRTLAGRMCCSALAQAAEARGMADHALAYLDALLAAASRGNLGEGAMPRMALLRADALLAVGRAQEAVSPLLAAQEDARWRGARPLLWRLHAALGRAYGALGRAHEAQAESAAARAVIAGLADEIPDAVLREGFLDKAFEALPGASA